MEALLADPETVARYHARCTGWVPASAGPGLPRSAAPVTGCLPLIRHRCEEPSCHNPDMGYGVETVETVARQINRDLAGR